MASTSADPQLRLTRLRLTRLRLGLAFAVLASLAACTQPAPQQTAGAPVVYGPRIVLTINFDFDSARIRPENYQTLDNLAAGLGDPSLAGTTFDVNGYTDVSGRFGYNVALSMRRAQAVVAYLASRGVPPSQMHAQGFGPLQLIDPYNPTSPTNRRVEIVAVR